MTGRTPTECLFKMCVGVYSMEKKREIKLAVAIPQVLTLLDRTLAYTSNINSSQILDQLWHFVDNIQNLPGQLGGSNLSATCRYHRDLLGLRQRGGHFSGNLE